MNNSARSVTFVIPCLNEEGSLPTVLQKINTVCREQLANRETEIVVSDNGSTDKSTDIARSHGARVVDCPTRGYGAALKCGIEAAKHEVVVFADADDTYNFLETPALLEKIEEGYDLVIGSRLGGDIRPGAMSFLHRRVGTPALNWLINLLYSRRGNRINDCNSGFRAFDRSRFLSWGVGSDGMEFASEMLVKALRNGVSMAHVPITLHTDAPGRKPKLKTWRDGTRHLLQILLESPELFHTVGLLVWVLSWGVLVTGWLSGPVTVGSASLLGFHSMLFAYFGTIIGAIIWGIGLLLAAKMDSGPLDYRYLATLEEDKLFWYSIALAVVCMIPFVMIIFSWAGESFRFLSLEREALMLTAAGSNGIVLLFQIFAAHLIKRA